MPFENIEIRPNGTIGVCCVSKFNITKDDGTTYVYGTDKLSDALNSASLKQFQNDISRGERPAECSACWIEESNGMSSKRQIENDRFKTKSDKIRTIDIKPGNICNIKCRICSSYASSKWISDEIKLMGKSAFPMYNWPETYDFDELYELAPYLEYIEISGGEPFLLDNHWKFITYLSENGYSKNIHIQFHTNGTIYPEKFISNLETFKKCQISLSIDGIGERFEYLRYPASWETVKSNWIKFSSNSNLSVSISHSVNSFNVYYIPEFANLCNELKTPVYWNLVHNVAALNNLSASASKKIIEHLKYSLPTDTSMQVNKLPPDDNWLYKMLLNNAGDSCDTIIKVLRNVDAIRSQDYSATFPELYRIMTDE